MGRSAITCAEVRAAGPGGSLAVPVGGIVTPLARDLAVELGVCLVEASPGSGPAVTPAPPDPSQDDLQQRVHAIVTSLLAAGGAGSTGPTRAGRPVKLVHGAQARLEPFGYPGPSPDQQVMTTDVVTSADGAPMAAGYMTLTRGSFPWSLSYDEVQVVLEGELHIGTPEGVRIGRPGDILYVPKGSQITFGTPSWARFVYVTFPANWEEQLS